MERNILFLKKKMVKIEFQTYFQKLKKITIQKLILIQKIKKIPKKIRWSFAIKREKIVGLPIKFSKSIK